MCVFQAGVWPTAESQVRGHSVQPDRYVESEGKNHGTRPTPAPLEGSNTSPLVLPSLHSATPPWVLVGEEMRDEHLLQMQVKRHHQKLVRPQALPKILLFQQLLHTKICTTGELQFPNHKTTRKTWLRLSHLAC